MLNLAPQNKGSNRGDTDINSSITYSDINNGQMNINKHTGEGTNKVKRHKAVRHNKTKEVLKRREHGARYGRNVIKPDSLML